MLSSAVFLKKTAPCTPLKSSREFLIRSKYSKHDIAFRGLMNCAHDGCMLTGELKKQKYVYYRSD